MNYWLEVPVETTDAQMDDFAVRLTMNGAEGLVLENEADFKTFLEQNRQYWDYVDDALLERMKGVARIKFYVTDDADGRVQMAKALEGITNPVSTAPLKEEDWAYSWQKYYHPLTIGEGWYIVPEWERGKTVPDGRTPVYLNPGLTFGTGSHASTQLCLTLLEQHLKEGDAVLDLGCGSGILSIAALCKGAGKAIGVDIDPKAVDVAYENAELNGIGRDRYTVRAGDVLSDTSLVEELAVLGPYPVVLANIVADVIIPLSAKAGAFLAPNGVFICSGIIDTRADEVENALKKNGLRILRKLQRDGWCSMAATLEDKQ
ncbi:MAG: 50S ribosomal protein L11 methyltransferase [Oscillospiraceae bacterium]|nr:50S ribosomal protein L11 methyltransferase [Oscillospiraceae bacterium]